LVAFEFSGRVREAFKKKGWDAWSIDIQQTEILSGKHLMFNIYNHVEWIKDMKFDLLIAHPPCTYTAITGNRWYKDSVERQMGIAKFVFWDMFEDIPMRCVEHPVSIISSQHRKPDQYVQPWEFGHGETKKTGLWLTNLPKLKPTNIVDGREPKVWLMGPSPTRKNDRSRTYQGIADAMAEQWGNGL